MSQSSCCWQGLRRWRRIRIMHPSHPASAGESAPSPWANYTGTQAAVQSPAAAAPWPAAAAASAAHPSGGATPWSAALSQTASPAGRVHQVQPGVGAVAAASVAGGAQVPQEHAPVQAPAAKAPTWTMYHGWVVLWQVELNDGSWTEYDAAFTPNLENHWLDPALPKQFSAMPGRNVTYTYDVAEFWQQNNETNGRRTIRRVLLALEEAEQMASRKERVAQHNVSNQNFEPCYARRNAANSRPRSQSASSANFRSRSRHG